MPPKRLPPQFKIYIGGLDHTATREGLEERLGKLGITVMSCSELIRPESGFPYAFVNVPPEQGVTAIKLLDKRVLFGREIRARESSR